MPGAEDGSLTVSTVSLTARRSADVAFDNILISLATTGLISAVNRSDFAQAGKDQIASYLSGVLARSMNREFHESLSWFEKYIHLRGSKWEDHQRSVGVSTGLAYFASRAVLEIVPALLDYGVKRSFGRRLRDSLLPWLVFLGASEVPTFLRRTSSLCTALSIDTPTPGEITLLRNKYLDAELAQLPAPPDFGSPALSYRMFLWMVSATDATDSRFLGRSESLGALLGLSQADTETALMSSRGATDFLSDVSRFCAFSLADPLHGLASSAAQAIDCATYSAQHDPYGVSRENTRQNLKTGAIAVIATGISLYSGANPKMLVAAAAPIIHGLTQQPASADSSARTRAAIQAAERTQEAVERFYKLVKPR